MQRGRDEQRGRRAPEQRGHRVELLRIDVAADDAGDEVAERDRREPDAHRETGEALGREPGHGAHADGAERQLADPLQEIARDEPEHRHARRRAAGEDAVRRGEHDEEAEPRERQAEGELRGAREIAAAACEPGPQRGEQRREEDDAADSAAWNHDVGTSQPNRRRSVKSRAKRLSDVGCCSNADQKTTAKMNSTSTTAMRATLVAIEAGEEEEVDEIQQRHQPG